MLSGGCDGVSRTKKDSEHCVTYLYKSDSIVCLSTSPTISIVHYNQLTKEQNQMCFKPRSRCGRVCVCICLRVRYYQLSGV